MNMPRTLVRVVVCAAGTLCGASYARDLTFEQRIRAQEAIERVYYSHQVGATRPFEEAVTRGLLEAKVRTYLRQSLALERIWKTPLTGVMLQREVERMARWTRMPGRLRELYAALGGDPFLIQECLARPILADRLSGRFFASDRILHARERAAAEELRGRLLAKQIDPFADHRDRVVVEVVRAGSTPGDPARLEVTPEEFEDFEARAPRRVGEVGPVREDREGLSILVTLARGPGELRLARFLVRKTPWERWWKEVEGTLDPGSVPAVALSASGLVVPADATDGGLCGPLGAALQSEPTAFAEVAGCSDDSWSNGSLDDVPDPRTLPAAVWTGSHVIVWGGRNGDTSINTGGRYDPATDTWAPTSVAGAPVVRSSHSAVWTGEVMVIWGGSTVQGGGYTSTGGRYDPTTDTWAPTSTAGAPSARAGHTAVWTGSRMVIWGGAYTNTGGRYDPVTDEWTATSTAGAPAARQGHQAVWTGSLMVVWGGAANTIPVSCLGTGGRYDPRNDTWTATSTAGAPGACQGHSAVWTGGQMVVWGGRGSGASAPPLNTGGLYDPATDIWRPTSVADAPSPRAGHAAVWTGNEMIVWGTGPNTPQPDTGGRYDPRTNRWMPTSTLNAPSARSGTAAVWAGERMVIWGGEDYFGYSNTGGRYDPAVDAWTPTATGDAPLGRQNHSVLWTGSVMIVWGGNSYVLSSNTGGRYDPVTDSWAPTSMENVPPPMSDQPAVWTGDQMIVWGGSGFVGEPMTGGRYDPMSDRWTAISSTDAPSSRRDQTAVWTGRQMVVWGGAVWNPSTFSWTYLDTGGRYDPVADAWTPMSMAGAPTGRQQHTAIWTGSRMVVWGGWGGALPFFSSGGRYDPEGDRWEPVSAANAPVGRQDHTAIWTGSLMVVWGGKREGEVLLSTGGRYDPAGDRWEPTALAQAPSARWHHTAVWTGRYMVVWGGWLPQDPFRHLFLDTGGRYDPDTDYWLPTSVAGAPSGRRHHTAVWVGDSMIVWGGANGGFATMNSGGRYCTCVPATYYGDADGDGFGDPAVTLESCVLPSGYASAAGDCDDLEASLWGTPGEAETLLFASDTLITWSPPASAGATAVVYDALRSGMPGDFLVAGICVATDVPDTMAADATPPATGGAFFYLVRAENGCPGGRGSGSLGRDSSGKARVGRSCP